MAGGGGERGVKSVKHTENIKIIENNNKMFYTQWNIKKKKNELGAKLFWSNGNRKGEQCGYGNRKRCAHTALKINRISKL